MAARDLRVVDTTVAEAAARDLIDDLCQGRALLLDRLRVVRVLVAQVLDRGREVPEEEDVVLADLLCDLDVRAICAVLSPTGAWQRQHGDSPTVPSSRPPFRQNFMFEVPEASVPAVEMCWLMSDAGMRISASETE